MNFDFSSLFNKLNADFDGILISNLKTLQYYTGLVLSAGVLFLTRKEAFLFVDFRYFELAKQRVKNCNVVLFSDLKTEFGRVLNLNKSHHVAVASEGLFVRDFLNFKNWFKNVEFVLSFELDNLIAGYRAIKSKDEIKKIRAAQKITDLVFSEILNFLRPGISELEVAREINSLICKYADSFAFDTIVVSGVRTSLPHGRPTNKILQAGEFVTMDFGAVVDGYCSDMTRTVCLNKPDSFQREIYEIVLSAQKLALNSLKVGSFCKDIDLIVRDYFRKFGFEKEFGHSLGHSIGLDCHEQPFLSPKSLQTVQNGVVLTVEPGLYFEKKFGVRIEDLVLVNFDGVFNFTISDKNLICL